MGYAYVDNNETIYYHDSINGVGLASGQSASLFFSINNGPLDNLIPGQSTVFVNSIKFKASGHIDPDDSDFNSASAFMLAGIVPFDMFNISTGPDLLDQYQQIEGWPLKGCFGSSSLMRARDASMSASDWQGVGSTFSWQKTWKPRKALLLNRLQSVCFAIRNGPKPSNGSDFNYFSSIEVQLKRGD